MKKRIDLQDEAAGPARDMRSLVFGAFAVWSVVLVCVFLLFEVLYQGGSFLKIMSPLEIVEEVAALIVLLIGISAAVSLLTGALSVAFYPFAKKRAFTMAEYTGNAFVVAFLFIFFYLATGIWVKELTIGKSATTHGILLDNRALATAVLFAAGFLLALFRREEIARFFRAKTRLPFRVVVVCGILAVFLSGIRATDTFILKKGTTMHAVAAPVPVEKPVNVILVTFDALSAVDMSLYGYHLKTTPVIDELAETSYVFENMFANYNATRPSAVSIMTGLYPFTHKMGNTDLDIYSLKGLRSLNLPRLLRQAGYETATMNSNIGRAHPYATDMAAYFAHKPLNIHRSADTRRSWLKAKVFVVMRLRTHLWLKDMGKRYFPASLTMQRAKNARKGGNPSAGRAPFPAEETFAAAARYLAGSRSPFFLWVHLFPPHDPYQPGKGYRFRFLKREDWLTGTEGIPLWDKEYYAGVGQRVIDKLRLQYDENILYADGEFGSFLEAIKKQGLFDSSILIVSSDHGEIFERGLIGHGCYGLYQPLVHLPLVIHLPGQKTGRRIASNAEHVDLAPTILDLLGLPVPGWMEGESLKPFMEGNRETSKPKFSIFSEGNGKYAKLRKGVVAVAEGRYKYIHYLERDRGELYDLAADPRERKDISRAETGRADRLKGLVRTRVIDRY